MSREGIGKGSRVSIRDGAGSWTERGDGAPRHVTGLLSGSRRGWVTPAGQGRLLGRCRGKAGPHGGKKGDRSRLGRKKCLTPRSGEEGKRFFQFPIFWFKQFFLQNLFERCLRGLKN
jgi:hypothetical protein